MLLIFVWTQGVVGIMCSGTLDIAASSWHLLGGSVLEEVTWRRKETVQLLGDGLRSQAILKQE